MASKPLHLTTPMRKMRKEEATKGAVSKFAAASRAEPIVYHGKSAVVGLPRSPRLMKTTSSPLRSQRKPKSRTHAENGIPPTVPTPSVTELTRPSTAAQRRHQPVNRTTSSIRKPPAGTQQHPKVAKSASTAVATTIVDQSASKGKDRIPMSVIQRRVEPHELDKLEEEEEDLSCNLTRVRKRLQYLNSIVILQRPPLIAQRQQQQSAIRTNSGAASPGAPAGASPSGGAKPKRRRSRSFGSISKPKLKSRTPVMMVLRALADSKEIEQLKKEERDLDSKLNRVQETIQSLKSTIVIRRPMKREDGDKQMNQLEGATALAPELLPAGDEYLSVDDGFQPGSSPKIDQLSGKACAKEMHSSAPLSPNLILDASTTESPSAAIYMDLRRRTIMATPPTGRRYQYRRPKQ